VTNTSNSQIARAQELATQLAQILELEFQALRQQELDQFEQLQPVKTDLLSEITLLAPPATLLQNEQDWQDFRVNMLVCRDLHRRNEVLIERKLESIRGTLQSLRIQESTSPIEVYDRLGQIARFSRAQGYNDA
jgi:flagellar biosynthesis/type III secretory pathway chaperone